MKIAVFAPSWPPGYAPNGIITYLSQLVPALRQLGHQVFVLTPNKARDLNDPAVIDLRSYTSNRTLLQRLKYRLSPDAAKFSEMSDALVSAVGELVRNQKIDVLEIEESFGWTYALSRRRIVPVVLRLHGPWFLNGRFNDPGETASDNSQRESQEGKAIAQAHFVSAPSAEVLRAVKDHYGLDLPASRVISNPVEAAPESAIWSVGGCEEQTLLYVGRFDRRKGGDLILRAFAALAAANPRLTLTFVGPDNGIRESDGSVLSFEQFAQANLPQLYRPRIRFLGQMKHADVMALRTKHFMTVVASQYEISPYSVLEPMALGCPIVATAVGGIPELINDGENGLLVPTQDPTALAAACQKLLDDPAFAARLGRQAWRDCCDLQSGKRIATQTVELYQDAIAAFNLCNTE